MIGRIELIDSIEQVEDRAKMKGRRTHRSALMLLGWRVTRRETTTGWPRGR